MRMAREIEPCLFLEADSIDDQSVTIPFADRISEPRRLAFLGQRPPIRENLPVVVVRLKEQHDQAGLLNDLPRRGVTIGIRYAVWETAPIRPIFAVVGLALLVQLFGPGLHRDFNAVGTEIHEIFRVRSSPDPRHIRRTIGQPRRGSREVRLSVSRSRSTRIGIVYPLRTGWNVHRDQTESYSKSMKYSHCPSIEEPSHYSARDARVQEKAGGAHLNNRRRISRERCPAKTQANPRRRSRKLPDCRRSQTDGTVGGPQSTVKRRAFTLK